MNHICVPLDCYLGGHLLFGTKIVAVISLQVPGSGWLPYASCARCCPYKLAVYELQVQPRHGFVRSKVNTCNRKIREKVLEHMWHGSKYFSSVHIFHSTKSNCIRGRTAVPVRVCKTNSRKTISISIVVRAASLYHRSVTPTALRQKLQRATRLLLRW